LNRTHGVTKWLMALAACLAALLVRAVRAEGPSPLGTLSGRVVNPEGQPVAGARVWTETIDSKTLSLKTLADARSDSEGRFRLGPVEPVYRPRYGGLHVEAAGLAGQVLPCSDLSIFPGCNSDIGTIRLDRGRIFTGQVVDADGTPRPNTPVFAASMSHSSGHTLGGSVKAPTQTDASGRFRTPPLPVGHLQLLVRVPERQRASVMPWPPIRPGGEEDLGTIRLEKDVPVAVVTKDEDGRPISAVAVLFAGTTDAEGRASMRGFGRDFQQQIQARKSGFALINWGVRRTEKGLYWHVVAGDGTEFGPFGELSMTLKRAGWIEGRAIDADTGEPVRLSRVVVCTFERKPTGEVVLKGCRSDFEQTEPGRFRASFPAPNEYHLTFTARGYHDAEAYTPKVTELKTIEGIVARMKRNTEGSAPQIAQQTIAGKVTRDGRPVQSGWVGLWALPRTRNAPNSPVMRERTAVGEPIVHGSAPIRDGSYRLDVPFQSEAWYVVAEEAGHPLTQVGPIAIGLNEKKSLEIACTEGGWIRGRVKDVPHGWEGQLWVVAFSKTAVREESRVAPDGTFSFPTLPPGEYGLKVGHEAYEDPEVYPGSLSRDHPEAFKQNADPWKRAKIVSVHPGRTTEGVEVELPQ
jgi:hypothetical protein